MIEKVTREVLKFFFKTFSSNCYLIKKKIMIDTGSKAARNELITDFKLSGLAFDKVTTILLTHTHYDHTGNVDLFKKAKIFVSEEEINNLDGENVYPISQFKNKQIKVIKVPGHTKGSLAFLYKKILFSGDTIFDKEGKIIGRTDLSESLPEKMEENIKKLLKLDFEIICPGH